MPLTGIQDTSITTPGSITGTKSIKTVEAGSWVFYTFNAMKTWFLSSFTNIADVPANYTGAANKKVRVKSTADGLEFVTDAFTSLTDVPSSFTGHGGKLVAVNSGATGLEFVVGSGGGSGISLSTYTLLSGLLTVKGTAGITATFSSGLLTITIAPGGHLDSGYFTFDSGDCDFSNSLVSDGLKIKIVTDGGSVPTIITPIILARTASGTITATNPLQYNVAINVTLQSDEFTTNISSWCWNQVGPNAPAGGIIQF